LLLYSWQGWVHGWNASYEESHLTTLFS
jgi:hypothetical protein